MQRPLAQRLPAIEYQQLDVMLGRMGLERSGGATDMYTALAKTLQGMFGIAISSLEIRRLFCATTAFLFKQQPQRFDSLPFRPTRDYAFLVNAAYPETAMQSTDAFNRFWLYLSVEVSNQAALLLQLSAPSAYETVTIDQFDPNKTTVQELRVYNGRNPEQFVAANPGGPILIQTRHGGRFIAVKCRAGLANPHTQHTWAAGVRRTLLYLDPAHVSLVGSFGDGVPGLTSNVDAWQVSEDTGSVHRVPFEHVLLDVAVTPDMFTNCTFDTDAVLVITKNLQLLQPYGWPKEQQVTIPSNYVRRITQLPKAFSDGLIVIASAPNYVLLPREYAEISRRVMSYLQHRLIEEGTSGSFHRGRQFNMSGATFNRFLMAVQGLANNADFECFMYAFAGKVPIQDMQLNKYIASDECEVIVDIGIEFRQPRGQKNRVVLFDTDATQPQVGPTNSFKLFSSLQGLALADDNAMGSVQWTKFNKLVGVGQLLEGCLKSKVYQRFYHHLFGTTTFELDIISDRLDYLRRRLIHLTDCWKSLSRSDEEWLAGYRFEMSLSTHNDNGVRVGAPNSQGTYDLDCLVKRVIDAVPVVLASTKSQCFLVREILDSTWLQLMYAQTQTAQGGAGLFPLINAPRELYLREGELRKRRYFQLSTLLNAFGLAFTVRARDYVDDRRQAHYEQQFEAWLGRLLTRPWV